MLELRIPNTFIRNVISKVKTPCDRGAKDLLADCMVVSIAFLAMCTENLPDGTEEQVLDELLSGLRIPNPKPECQQESLQVQIM